MPSVVVIELSLLQSKVVRPYSRRPAQLTSREKNWTQVVKGVDAILRFA